MKRIIYLLVSIFLITGCSIQKRQYRKGFTVDWKKDYSSVQDQKKASLDYEPIQSLEIKNTNVEPAEFKNETTDITTKNKAKESPTLSGHKSMDPIESNDRNAIKDKSSPKKRSFSSEPEEPVAKSDKKVQGLGLAGFIISLVGVVVIWFSVLIGALFGILGLIFGAIAISKINKQPNKYKGKGFAVTSLIIGILLVVVSALGILVLMAV